METPIGKAFTEIELKKVEEAFNIRLSENNKKLLLGGNPSEIIEINGKESRLTLKRKFNADVIAEVSHKKETLEIPDIIGGHKLTRNDKKSLMDGDVILLNTKKGDAYIQIDKELNTVIVRSSKEMGIPNVIGNDKKHNYKGYELTAADKELLSNGHMLPPKVLCSPDGYILARFGITEDNKGVKFANPISIPKKEVQAYIEKYNVTQEKPIEKKLKQNDELTQNSAFVKPLDIDDKQKLEYLYKNGMGEINYLFGDKSVKRDEFLKKYDLLNDYTSANSLSKEYSVEERADNYSSMKSIKDKIDIHNENFVAKAKSQFIALGGIEEPIKGIVNRDDEFLTAFQKGDIDKIEMMSKEGYIPSLRVRESPIVLFPESDKVSNRVNELFFSKENDKTPVVQKVVLRNLDEEFLAALAVRDFEKLNKMSKEDNYEPSKKALETAHKLPNLSDHDKVAIKTIFPEKQKEPLLAEKETSLEVVKNNKTNNVKIKETDEKGSTNKVHKFGNIIAGAFRDM